MWPFSLFRKKVGLEASPAPIYFTNTLTRRKDLFVPLKSGFVSMYSCGPTVYSRAHIGNMKAAIFADLVARVLLDAGYHVRRVMNITDVGHLVGDGDHGEDKMAKGAREEQKKPEEIAEHYTSLFLQDLRALGVPVEDMHFPRATEYIDEQIALIKTLEEKGFAYRAQDGIYFDTARFPNYGKLGGADGSEMLPGARIEKIPGKRSAKDFVLWRDARPGDLQQWKSPWGMGNPGWHIECSAMVRALLGLEIDIHTGGMDHIPTHHNNEIAQSECANGKPLARYWLHEAFLTVGADKLSKSLKNDVYVPEFAKRGYHPLSLRYFFLQAHYRTPMSFSWDAIEAADAALTRLWKAAYDMQREAGSQADDSEERMELIARMRDDLSTPQALAILWDALKSDELSPQQKWGVVIAAEPLLGLMLTNPPIARPLEMTGLPDDIQKLVYERDLARDAKDYARADDLRYQLQNRGYRVDDGTSGTLLTAERE